MGCDAVGFDLRIWGEVLGTLWTSRHRSKYMLDPNVTLPLSIDTNTWPSVFDTGVGLGMPVELRTRMFWDGLPLPDFIGPNTPFWESLDELHRYLAAHESPYRNFKTVQAFQCTSRDAAPNVGHGYSPLGFDVADQGFISGLTDCGLNENEWAVLRPQFGKHLNDRHLFDDLHVAKDYCELISDIVREHAPFEPYLLAWE